MNTEEKVPKEKTELFSSDFLLPETGGKTLLIATKDAFLNHGAFVRERVHRPVTLIDPTDALSLFSLGDGFSSVVCLGTKVASLGRYASSLLSLPCYVLPDEIDARPLLSPIVSVTVGGKETHFPAKLPQICVFEDWLISHDKAYARIASYSLSAFEWVFKADLFGGEEGKAEEVWDLVEGIYGKRTTGRGLLEADSTLFSLPRGEVGTLGQTMGNDLLALDKLLKTYLLFYRKGYLRPYALTSRVELYDRFLALRTKHYALLKTIGDSLPRMKRIYFSLGGKNASYDSLGAIRSMKPTEESPLYLMHEFGLLE